MLCGNARAAEVNEEWLEYFINTSPPSLSGDRSGRLSERRKETRSGVSFLLHSVIMAIGPLESGMSWFFEKSPISSLHDLGQGVTKLAIR